MNKKETLRDIMTMAWAFVKRNGYTMSEALKTAWRNIKLKAAMAKRICKFYFQKVDGTIREAFGTLNAAFACHRWRRQPPQERHGTGLFRHREARMALLQARKPYQNRTLTLT